MRGPALLALCLSITSALEYTAWFYDSDHDRYTDAQVSAVCDYYDLNALYYSLSIKKCSNESGVFDPGYEAIVKQRILTLKAAGVYTRLYLLQDVGFLDGSYGPTAWVGYIDAANNFLGRNPDVAEAVLGLHFDLEPHQNQYWASNQTALFGMFMTLLDDIGVYVRDGVSVPLLADKGLSIDVPHWFKGQPYAQGYPQNLTQHDYTLAFMIYEGIGDELSDFFTADSELEDIPGIIGIGHMEFATVREMVALRAQVSSRFQAVHGSSFLGVAFYHFLHLFDEYQALVPWSPAPESLGGACVEERSWEALADASRHSLAFETGGLGKLMVEDKVEAWACLRDHPCVAQLGGSVGDWMCFVFHETRSHWLPWDLESRLQLIQPPS